MWTREELKYRGKAAFKAHYWKAVIVAVILTIVVGVGNGGSSGRSDSSPDKTNAVQAAIDESMNTVLGDNIGPVVEHVTDTIASGFNSGGFAGWIIGSLWFGVALVFALVSLLFGIVIGNPIEVGGCRFFIKERTSEPTVGMLLDPYKSGYIGKVIVTMLLRDIYTFLWSLLLVVPGIVKSYEYRMIPYLLAERPDMDPSEAFGLSKEMMNGEKWNAFVLDISFILWRFLSAITFNLVGIFYVQPYVQATNAELYAVLKENKGIHL